MHKKFYLRLKFRFKKTASFIKYFSVKISHKIIIKKQENLNDFFIKPGYTLDIKTRSLIFY